jgi:hypothetical protein
MIQRNVVFLSVLALSLVADCSCGDGKSLGPSSQQPNANLTCTYDDGASEALERGARLLGVVNSWRLNPAGSCDQDV